MKKFLSVNDLGNLKEALNLYEEILYKERQLQFEKEKEEQRQYEELLRRRDAERRHREEMEFLEEQEYQRQREEERRRADLERHHRDEMKLREQEERNRHFEAVSRSHSTGSSTSQSDQRSTSRQCNTCAYNGRCSMAYTRPNCASYRPR